MTRSPRVATCPVCGRVWACDPSDVVQVPQHTPTPDAPGLCSFAGAVRTRRSTVVVQRQDGASVPEGER